MLTKSFLDAIQDEIKNWGFKNFGDSTGWDAIRNCGLGVSEEVGELNHSILKMVQGIRQSEDHEAKAKDAVGDICVYLMDMCNRMGWSFQDIIDDTWDEVRLRDWTEEREETHNTYSPADNNILPTHQASSSPYTETAVFGD